MNVQTLKLLIPLFATTFLLAPLQSMAQDSQSFKVSCQFGQNESILTFKPNKQVMNTRTNSVLGSSGQWTLLDAGEFKKIVILTSYKSDPSLGVARQKLWTSLELILDSDMRTIVTSKSVVTTIDQFGQLHDSVNTLLRCDRLPN